MKQYFEKLELLPGATPDEVKTAYRDLAKVWHPDRFISDSPRLKSKAAEKLAEINEAYEKIRAYQARQKARKQSGGENPNPSPGNPNYTGYKPYSPDTSSGSGQSYSGYARPTPNGRPQHRRPSGNGSTRSQPNAYRSRPRHHSTSRARPSSNGNTGNGNGSTQTSQTPFRQSTASAHTLARRRQTSIQYGNYGHNYTYASKKRRRAKNSMAIYLAAGALLAIAVAGIFFFLRQNDANPPTLAEWKTGPDISASATPPGSEQGAVSSPAAMTVDAGDAALQAENLATTGQRPINTRKLSTHQAPVGFFTIGSLKSDVIAVQGEPEQTMHGLFRYGFSSVFFEDDVVIGWHQSHDTQLMVKMIPIKGYEATFFTKGSTRDEVVAVQGTPDHYRDRGRELRYGESRVSFEKGRVVSWHQHADTPLRAKLLPRVISNASHFTFNSTRDEVLSIQGTPTHFADNIYHYGYSTIQFKDNRVIGWNQAASYPLKIDLKPSTPTSTKFFTKGSTRDEVIAAQGTPDQYGEQIFKYGHSSISFENDRVVSWYESAASLLKARDE
ncbi:MAG: J domain-containing protein [Rhodothermales bacterium]